MANSQDFTATLKEMMGAFPMDTAAFEDAWKTSAGYSEKATSIALDAAGKTTDISMGWTMETLGRMGELAKAKPAPTDYAQAMADFASAQMTSVSDHMTALTDVARTMQAETLELMMSAGKEVADDATANATTAAKATETATNKSASAARSTTRKTTAAAKKTTEAAASAAEAPKTDAN